MIPIERIRDPFTRKAWESLYVHRFDSLKYLPVGETEYGLDLARGQTVKVISVSQF